MKMKSSLLLLTVCLAISGTNAGAAIIFTESLGTVTATTAIATHETNNGFDNDDLTFSGTADLRATTASTGYAGASGSTNVFLTSNTSRTFRIDGISTEGFTVGSIGISFGALKSTTTSNMATLVLDFSTNGTDWTPLALPAQPTGSGTANWRLVTLSDTSIPISPTLSLRWTNTDATVQYRIDDITLVPEPAAVLLGGLGFLGLLRRRR
jgi:hypothetical protein